MKSSTNPVLTFWGAAQTVTGSMHLLSAGGRNYLLDCGLFQGRRAEARTRNSEFPFDPRQIHAVILSHAHIDHCGNLPNLVRQGFDGPIYCTPATRDLLAVMLADSAKIQEEDAAFVNRHKERGQPPVLPLYSRKDVLATLRLVKGCPYVMEHDLGHEMRLRLVEAGHLLGSAMVNLTLPGPQRDRTLTFTGDLGRKGMAILRDPAPVPAGEIVITECTYGGRNHPGVEILGAELGQVVRRTIDRGGKVIIPAFSLGRTQTIVYQLHLLFHQQVLPSMPIFVDSPLSAAATNVFRLHPECFDDETGLLLQDDPDLFGEKRVRYVSDVEESKKLNQRKEPCIIIASSGMCEAGRILHHLKHNIEDARNTVLIIGFQAPDTLGRRLVERRPEVRIHDRFWKLKAEVVIMNGFSSHAGRDELLAALGPLAQSTHKIRLVHGEPDQAQALMQGLGQAGFKDVGYPARGETVGWA